MNNQRRERLKAAITHLDEARALIDEAYEDEQQAYDNLPDSMKQTEKAEAMESAITSLEDASSHCESAIGSIEEATGS